MWRGNRSLVLWVDVRRFPFVRRTGAEAPPWPVEPGSGSSPPGLARHRPCSLTASNTQAKSVQTLREEAQQILNQINDNGNRISTLDEEINGAHIEFGTLHSQIHRTELQIASAQRTIGVLHSGLVARAAALYEGAGGANDFSESASSVQQQGAMSVCSQAAAAEDQQRIDKYRNARDARTHAKAQLDAADKSENEQLSCSRPTSTRSSDSTSRKSRCTTRRTPSCRPRSSTRRSPRRTPPRRLRLVRPAPHKPRPGRQPSRPRTMAEAGRRPQRHEHRRRSRPGAGTERRRRDCGRRRGDRSSATSTCSPHPAPTPSTAPASQCSPGRQPA